MGEPWVPPRLAADGVLLPWARETLGDERLVGALPRAGVDLARSRDPLFGVEQHLLPHGAEVRRVAIPVLPFKNRETKRERSVGDPSL